MAFGDDNMHAKWPKGFLNSFFKFLISLILKFLIFINMTKNVLLFLCKLRGERERERENFVWSVIHSILYEYWFGSELGPKCSTAWWSHICPLFLYWRTAEALESGPHLIYIYIVPCAIYNNTLPSSPFYHY